MRTPRVEYVSLWVSRMLPDEVQKDERRKDWVVVGTTGGRFGLYMVRMWMASWKRTVRVGDLSVY